MTSQYFGGRISGGTIGGFGALEKYHEGTLSAEKALLIRNIAQDLQGVLKFPMDIASEPIDRVVAALKSKVPNPLTHSLSHDSRVQTHICQAMAHAINHRYGRHIIDTNATPQQVCMQTSEIMSTLFGGLKSEFLGVAGDVKRSLGNLAILRRALESSFDKLYNTVQLGSDDVAKLQSYGIQQLYHSVIEEIDRQMAILANVIGTTIDPTTRTIVDLTDQDRDFSGFVKSLKHDMGTPDLSRKMTYMLAGVNGVAVIAETIDRALKRLGHSVQEYKQYRTTPEFVNHLHEVFERDGHKSTSDEVARFVAAVQLVKLNDYAHDDIVAYLNDKANKVKADPRGAIAHAKNPHAKHGKAKVKGRGVGGAEGNNSLEKRLERQRTSRDVLFRDFEQRLEQQYKQIFSAIEVLAKRLGGQGGTAVPVDDHLTHFVNCMVDLDSTGGVDREKFYLALTGYQQDPASKEERQRFLGQLEAASKSLKPLIIGPSGEHFQTIKSAIDRLIETVDRFKETYLKPITVVGAAKAVLDNSGAYDDNSDDDTYGGARKRRDNVKQELQAAKSAIRDAEKSNSLADHAVDDAADKLRSADHHLTNATEGAGEGTFVTLGQAIRHLQFYYNVAKVKHNLMIASKDIKLYSKDYETILGDAVGDLVIKTKRTYEAQRRSYDDQSVPLPPNSHDTQMLKAWVDAPNKYDDAGWKGTGSLPDTRQAAREYRLSVKDSALKYLKETMNVKIDLLKTVEAIDIYLANFADAIASNPNDVKELNQLLKSVDIVAKWFTDKSGNTIADLFETTPSSLCDVTEVTTSSSFTNGNEHYYKWVEKLIHPDNGDVHSVRLPSNPFLGMLPGRNSNDEDLVFDQIIEKAKKATLSVRVLDNLVATFAKLGSQYGNTNLNNKTFMPPGVIFKNLRKYIYHSAIVMGMQTSAGNSEYQPYSGETLSAETNIGSDGSKDVTHMENKPIRVGTDGYADTNPRPDTAAALRSFTSDGKYASNPLVAERWVRNKFAMAFSSIYDGEGKPLNGFSDNWYDTDQLLLMCIKSMVAKVFTVIGTYGVFNKPLDRYKTLSSTRLILGGDYSTPEIIPAAVELYIRLPLLAEFYREVFDFGGGESGNNPSGPATDNKKITLVPEFDGVWENFVRIVFEDAKYVVEGTYSENHVKSLIREVNDIYNKYKTPGEKSTVQDVISAFVAEINRRYGVVKQTEINSYLKDKRRYDVVDAAYNSEDRLDYNILDERDQTGRRPAPSDRFDHMFTSEERSIDNPYTAKYTTLIRDFRNRLDSSIKKLLPHGNKPTKVSFDQTVRAYKQQVDNAKTSEEKYKIVLKAMQGVDQLSNVNQQKAVMFHEAVLAPLHTLYSIWTIMNTFIRTVQSMDLLEIERIVNTCSESDNHHEWGDYNVALCTARKGYERYLKLGDLKYRGVTLDNKTPPTYTSIPSNMPGTDAPESILVYRGTYGARDDLRWHDITAIATAAHNKPSDKPRAFEGIKRFVIDREKLFLDFMNLTFSLAADLGDLASVKVQQGNLLIEYGQLAEYCSTLLQSVKKNLELFRGVIDNKIISQVEGGASPGSSPDPASIYFLDEHLMERIFRDSRQGTSKSFTGIGIIKTNELLSRTFKRFVTPWTVLARLEHGPVFAGPTGAENESNYCAKALYAHEKSLLLDSFERPMSRLVYWNPRSQVSKGAAESAVRRATRVTYKNALRQPGVRNKDINNWPYAVIPAIDRSGGEDDDIKSLKALQDAMRMLQKEIKDTLVLPAVGGAGNDNDEQVVTDEHKEDDNEEPPHMPAYSDYAARRAKREAEDVAPAETSDDGHIDSQHEEEKYDTPRETFEDGLDDSQYAHVDTPPSAHSDDPLYYNTTKTRESSAPANAVKSELSSTSAFVPQAEVLDSSDHDFVDAETAPSVSVTAMRKGPRTSTAPIRKRVPARSIPEADEPEVSHAVNKQDAADTVFKYFDGTQVAAGQLGGNLGTEGDPTVVDDVDFRDVPEGRRAHAKTLIARYNALSKQRERVFQSSIRTPLDNRMKWYTDPSNGTEGNWFYGQLDPPTAREGVDDGDIDGAQFEGGLLIRLNEILSKYLYNGWDTTTKKMYTGLINKFANGSHVAATSKGQALNDIHDIFYDLERSGASSGIIGVPAQHVTIFATLARAMRNILINTRRSGDPEYRIDSMMEVPIHMKETLRANLPHFDKLFRLVIKKAELLRQVSQQVSLVRQLPYAIKYGINRCSHLVPNLVFQRAGDGRTTFPNVNAFDRERYTQTQRAYYAPNAALLEPNDILHVDTGFVIRNAATAATAWVDHAGGSELAAYMKNTPTKTQSFEWIRGLSAINAPFPAGKRYRETWGHTVCNYNSDPNSFVGYQPYEELGQDASKRWHTELLDNIANSAISLSKCATDTYKELADEPKYLETHEGFINDYVNMNKYQPIMLLSQLQVALKPRFRSDPRSQVPTGGEWDFDNNEGYARANFMLPLYRSGEAPFKLAYGSRLIMGRPEIKPGLEYMPGMAALLERYNGVSSADSRLEKTDYERFTVAHTVLLRYLIDLRHYRAVLDTGSSGRLYSDGGRAAPGARLFDTPLNIEMVDATDPDFLPATIEYKFSDTLKSYPAQCTLDEVIAITESSDQDSTLRNIVATVSNNPQPINSRATARIYNIIDMNIVPINLHALMREIPLVNVINYSYTCDRMVQDALLPESELQASDKGRVIPPDYEVSSSRGMLTKMLVYPYTPVCNKEYYGYLARLATGDSGLDLGRPKFISDQLWNKVLLQELYTQRGKPNNTRRADESGPAADNAQRRALKHFLQNPGDLQRALQLSGAETVALHDALRTDDVNTVTWGIRNVLDDRGLHNFANTVWTNERVLAVAQGLIPTLILIEKAQDPYVIRKILETAPGINGVFKQVSSNFDDKTIRRNAIAAGLATIVLVAFEETLRDNGEPELYENNGNLSFPNKSESGTTVEHIDLTTPAGYVGTAVRHDLAAIGRLRFDTTFIRNQFFLVNLQRVMRMIMRDEVSYLESPVVNSSSVINRQVTEYASNETFDADVFQN